MMPVLAFLAAAGVVLVTLLFIANATLEKSQSPVIITSQRSGLPESPRHGDGVQTLTTTPAPAPDMTLQAVLYAQPKPVLDAIPKIHGDASEARAEVPLQNEPGAPPTDHWRNHYRRSQSVDRFSIKGQ